MQHQDEMVSSGQLIDLGVKIDKDFLLFQILQSITNCTLIFTIDTSNGSAEMLSLFMLDS